MGNFSFSLSDIKRQLGPGLGIRSSLYLVEVAVVGSMSKKIAILCLSTALPEKRIGSVDLYHKGRKYKIRGETDLDGSYVINVTDDSSMKIRQLFDGWLRDVDNTTPRDSNAYVGLFGDGDGFEAIKIANGVMQAVNEIKTLWAFDTSVTAAKNLIFNNLPYPSYQSEVNIWQLSKTRDKIYGYKLTNCFPVELGAVEVSGENENQLSMFSVTFAYSDMEPIVDNGFIAGMLGAGLGEIGADTLNSFDGLLQSSEVYRSEGFPG